MSTELFSEPPGEAQTLLGVLASITYRNEDNGYTIARFEREGDDHPITIVGVMPGVEQGDTLALRGKWKVHPRYGEQVEVQRCEVRPPTGRNGLVRYLGSGRIRGVGPKTAEKIVDALGLDVLERLRENPALLVTVPGISKAKAAVISHQLAEQEEAAAALVFLQEYGLGPAHAQRVYKHYGVRTVEVVRENPYRLADEVFGVGFRLADGVARSMGHELDSAFRLAAGLKYLLGRASLEGHVGLPVEELVQRAAPFLSVHEHDLEAVLEACVGDGRLIEDGLVYHPELWNAEVTVGDHVRRLLEAGEPLIEIPPENAVTWAEEVNRLELAADQHQALITALGSSMSVITGGPGVGKTTIVRCLIEVLVKQDRRVALAAPTGRAARRLAQATGREASTLHRLLGITPATIGFRLEREEPLPIDVLVVDETSMVDVSLMAAVTQALPEGAGVVLVGDVDQLPSVGPGAVLADFIASGVVPVARLTTIFRQAAHSGIVRVAHELNAGQRPEFDPGPDGQAFFIERDDPAGVVDALRTMVVERIPRRFGLDAKTEVQVITPMHAGPLGTTALNDMLREALNPADSRRGEITRYGRTFREGDKVMQVRNNYDLNVFNGDIGILQTISEEHDLVWIEFEGRRVEYGIDALDQLEPAYAITCHKSQGSEFPAVVFPLVSGHAVMLKRNLVYTAFTRAKQVLVAVGEQRALGRATTSIGSGDRHSRLAERLRGTAVGELSSTPERHPDPLPPDAWQPDEVHPD